MWLRTHKLKLLSKYVSNHQTSRLPCVFTVGTGMVVESKVVTCASRPVTTLEQLGRPYMVFYIQRQELDNLCFLLLCAGELDNLCFLLLCGYQLVSVEFYTETKHDIHMHMRLTHMNTYIWYVRTYIHTYLCTIYTHICSFIHTYTQV